MPSFRLRQDVYRKNDRQNNQADQDEYERLAAIRQSHHAVILAAHFAPSSKWTAGRRFLAKRGRAVQIPLPAPDPLFKGERVPLDAC
jgi:hypothetical protein